MADAPESPVESYLPAIALGAAALVLLLLTAGAGDAERTEEAALVPAAMIEGGELAGEAYVPLDLLPPGEEEARLQALVLRTIRENPEIVMEAVGILREREAEAAALAAADAMETVGPLLVAGEDAGVIGNPDGAVTVVEFFDYNCGFCRRVTDAVIGLTLADEDVRIVLREFPILGEESVAAARVALAARMQDEEGYGRLHEALLRMSGRANEESALALAAEEGLDVERIRADMVSAEIDAHIAASMDFARQLGINGTPAFVIGDELIPGAVGLEELQAAVEAAREG